MPARATVRRRQWHVTLQVTHGHMEGAAGSTRFVRDASSTDRQPPEGAAASAAASAVSAPGTVADDEATSANGGECVHADKVLPHRLGAGTRIDLLSIDIEGMEPEVLRCFPFADLGVHAVLIETDKARPPQQGSHTVPTCASLKQAGDLREVDRFFHRHGFVNEQTFTSGYLPNGLRYANWLDNLFVRRRRPAVRPPWTYNASEKVVGTRVGSLRPWTIPRQCSKEDYLARAQWCAPWHEWEPAADKWGPCTL